MTDSSDKLNQSGVEALRNSNLKEAIAYFDQAIDLNPNEDVYLANRAEAYRLNGNHDLALADIDMAVELNDSIENLQCRAEIYESKSLIPEAVADYRHILEMDSANDAIRIKIAALEKQSSSPEAAQRILDDALDIDDSNLELLEERAELYIDSGKIQHAVVDYRRILEIDPENARLKEDLASAKTELGELRLELNDALVEKEVALTKLEVLLSSLTYRGSSQGFSLDYSKLQSSFQQKKPAPVITQAIPDIKPAQPAAV